MSEKIAKAFPTEDALKNYLKDHPNADKSKHFVQKSDVSKAAPEEEKQAEPSKSEERPKKGWKGLFKDLSEKATSFMTNAPKQVQKFVGDEGHRAKVLGQVKDQLVKSPERLQKQLISTAKHEIHEFKEAGKAVQVLMRGGTLDKEQKKALKTVVTHMAITAAATAFAASGPFTGAAIFGKNIAKHVALKAVSKYLGKAHVLEELGHIGHGVASLMTHLAAEGKKLPSDQVLANFAMAAVAKELGNVDNEMIRKAIEDSAKSSKEAHDLGMLLRVAHSV